MVSSLRLHKDGRIFNQPNKPGKKLDAIKESILIFVETGKVYTSLFICLNQYVGDPKLYWKCLTSFQGISSGNQKFYSN